MCSIIVTIKQKVPATKNKVSKNAIAKEDTKMLKKFLGIFKRDKSGFSDEELKWQLKMGKRALRTLSGIAIIGGILLHVWIIPNLLTDFFRNKSFIITYVIPIVILTGAVFIYMIICVLIGVEIEEKLFKCGKIQDQLKRNSEEQRTTKLFSCLKQQDFSKLGVKWAMIDGLFQKFLECGMIRIESTNEGDVNISISEPTRDMNSLFIKHEELLTYFNFKED